MVTVPMAAAKAGRTLVNGTDTVAVTWDPG
jgi:hypothetical protein